MSADGRCTCRPSSVIRGAFQFACPIHGPNNVLPELLRKRLKMRCECGWSRGPEPIRQPSVICEVHAEQDIRAGMKQAQGGAMRCICDWKRSGLGAEPRPATGCEVHGLGGPMQMMMKGEDTRQQAGMLKAKHDVGYSEGTASEQAWDRATDSGECETGYMAGHDPRRVRDIYDTIAAEKGISREVAKAEVGGRMHGNHQNDGHLDRLTPREEARVGAALKIGAEQERKMQPSSGPKHTCDTDTGQYTKCRACELDQRADLAFAGVPGEIGTRLVHIEGMEKDDDRHVFTSGAMSSGKKPPYTAITLHCLERFANQRGYGDNKYGLDNWRKGASDLTFILDRINHGIEHFHKLAEQVKAGSIGMMGIPGEDDAAAVCCNAMFVMEWQLERMKAANTKMDGAGSQRASDRCDKCGNLYTNHLDGICPGSSKVAGPGNPGY